jgi:hypothetical protein
MALHCGRGRRSGQPEQARNVVDGLALVQHVSRSGMVHYPFGLAGLPPASPAEAGAIDAELARLLDVNDALADLAVAEGVHQAVLGNLDRAGSTLDAFGKGGFPPEPAVVQTPRSGTSLTHRAGLHLRSGLAPGSSPVPGLAATPRSAGDPAVNHWLAGLLPPPEQVGCVVSWSAGGAEQRVVVTQAQLGLQPIDLLSAVRTDFEPAMTDLDDRIVGHVITTHAPPAGAELAIRYFEPIDGSVSFFELSALVAALRGVLVGARPVRPSDLVRPAGDDPVPADLDDAVELPRDRVSAVRAGLAGLGTDIADYLADTTAAVADPDAVLSTIDVLAGRFGELVVRAGGFGLAGSGWSEFAAWRRTVYADTEAVLGSTVDRLTVTLARADAAIAEYDALPDVTGERDRFRILQRAERLLTTSPTSPRPADPAELRATVGTRRAEFLARRDALAGVAGTDPATLVELLSHLRTLLPITGFDPVDLDLTPIEARVQAFALDLLARARALGQDIAGRLAAADAALATHDATAPGPARVAAATTALQALLGPDAIAVAECTLPPGLATEWHNAYLGADQLTAHLDREFPVDDWLHGVARVRERLRHWERVILLGGALGRPEPDLVPVQFPHRPGEPWLGLEYPPEHVIDGDRLLYTAHYAAPFAPGQPACGLLLDEWTELIPQPVETTGIACHFDRPGAEPPQALLLVTPPRQTGPWRFDDLVATLHETLDLAKSRAVEPVHLDQTRYAQLLPASVLTATRHPITIATDLARNNLRQE